VLVLRVRIALIRSRILPVVAVVKIKRKKKSKKRKSSKSRNKKKKKKGKKRKRSKSSKKKKIVKGKRSGYTFFMMEERPNFVEKNPTATFGELAKIIGKHWREMPDQDKNKFIEMAEQDKERYERQMEKYSDDSSSSEEKPKKKKRKSSIKRDPNEPTRPLNPYILWAKDNRKKIKEDNPDVPGQEINKLCGKAWRNLPEGKKQHYNDLAQKDKSRYSKQMEEYRKNQAIEKEENLAMEKEKNNASTENKNNGIINENSNDNSRGSIKIEDKIKPEKTNDKKPKKSSDKMDSY